MKYLIIYTCTITNVVNSHGHVLIYSQTDAGWEEYFDYIFPDDEGTKPNLKLLAMAKQWKQTESSDSEESSDESDDSDRDVDTTEVNPAHRSDDTEAKRRKIDDSDPGVSSPGGSKGPVPPPGMKNIDADDDSTSSESESSSSESESSSSDSDDRS